jgi:hypothetical protein
MAPQIKIGIIAGRCDSDMMSAPGIDQKLRWKRPDKVHSDVAIWWFLKTHYPAVEAMLIEPDKDVEGFKAKLEANDINISLGWDAVSAHIDEFGSAAFGEECKVGKGYAEQMKEILRSPKSKCWPPASVQDLVNNKAYIEVAKEKGIPVPPTIRCEEGRSAEKLLPAVQEKGWKNLIVKPVPSSWSAGLEVFDPVDKLYKNPKPLVEYFKKQETAKVILAQECLEGMETYPEVRCYWFGDEYMYTVGNIKNGKITDSPEAYRYEDGSGTLDSKWADPARALATMVKQRVLPELRGFQGQKLSCSYPWLMRIDVGMHDEGLTDKEMKADWEGKTVHFLNEVESAPTLYLDDRFGHPKNWIEFYTRKIVETAYEVTGIQAGLKLEVKPCPISVPAKKAVTKKSPKTSAKVTKKTTAKVTAKATAKVTAKSAKTTAKTTVKKISKKG